MFDSDGALLTAPQIILRYGYPFERFHYETDDGFILSAFRISGGKGSRPEEIYKKKKPVVLL